MPSGLRLSVSQKATFKFLDAFSPKSVYLEENDKETGLILFYFLSSPPKIGLFFQIRGTIQTISWGFL